MRVKPDGHSWANHLVTYAIHGEVAPMEHAQAAREQFEHGEELLRDVLHQLSTDSDLDDVTRPDKYKRLASDIRAFLFAGKAGA